MVDKQILDEFELPMWALTLRQPVASAVMRKHKIFVLRGFKPHEVEVFALHAGKADLHVFQSALGHFVDGWPGLERLPRGVLGIVRIVEVHHLAEWFDYSGLKALEASLGYWNRASKYKKYAWELEVVTEFEYPIAARGMPGFWRWWPDAEERKRLGGPDWLKSLDGRISPDGTRFID